VLNYPSDVTLYPQIKSLFFASNLCYSTEQTHGDQLIKRGSKNNQFKMEKDHPS